MQYVFDGGKPDWFNSAPVVVDGEPINLMYMDIAVNFDFWYCKLTLPTGGDS